MTTLGALGAIFSQYGDESDDDHVEEDTIIIKEEALDIPEEKLVVVANRNGDMTMASTQESSPGPLWPTAIPEGPLSTSSYSGAAYSVPRSPLKEETEDSESDSDDEQVAGGVELVPSDEKDSDDEDPDSDHEVEEGVVKKPPKVKGELLYQDLPPIEDLFISVPHEKTKPIGVIKSVVDPLVIVEAYPNTPALDIDSVLFLEHGDRVLGAIFDVLGQVKQPFYSVRFNSLQHIANRKVEKGMEVYCAPSTPHTSFVLLAQLEKLKGSDASWKDDIEPPAEAQEFSDDEKEAAVRNKHRKRKSRIRLQGQGQFQRTSAPGQGQGQSPFVPNPHYQNQTQQNPHYQNQSQPPNYYQYQWGQFQSYPYSWHTHPASQVPVPCPSSGPVSVPAPRWPHPHPHQYYQNQMYPNPNLNSNMYRPPPPPPPPPKKMNHNPIPPPPGTSYGYR